MFYLFVVYVTTLSVTQDYIVLNKWITLINEIERMWKEAVMKFAQRD
jgi:hypothetical protein